jgi:hypothetical protein
MDNNKRQRDRSAEYEKRPETDEAQASSAGFEIKCLHAAVLLLLVVAAGTCLTTGSVPVLGQTEKTVSPSSQPISPDECPPPLPTNAPASDCRPPKHWEKGKWWKDSPTNQHSVFFTDAETPTIILKPAAANRDYFRLSDLEVAAPKSSPLTITLHRGEKDQHLHVTNACTIHTRVHLHVSEADLVVENKLVVGGRLTLDKLSHLTANANLLVRADTNRGYGHLTVTGGSLTVTNKDGKSGKLIIGEMSTNKGITTTNQGILTVDGGTVEADFIQVLPGSQFIFKSGTVKVGTMMITNLPYVLGDGVHQAIMSLSGGGTADFAHGLVVTNNAILTGNGTVSGGVVNYGAIAAGTSEDKLTFADDPNFPYGTLFSVVTNCGSMYMTNQGTLTFQGTVYNNVAAPFTAINLDMTNHVCTNQFASIGGLINTLEYKGSVTDANWTDLTNTLGTGEILTFVDPNAPATNRFYHIRVTQQ